MAIEFKRATKLSSRLRLALIGPPGSGKTYTGLTVARHLGGRVAVIDTERGSASKYADLFDFDVLELSDSFHPARYVEAVRAAEAAGYDVLLVDSLSHAWIGKDGGLELHDRAVDRQKTKNSYTAWAEVTPHHMALVQALVQCKCHVIVTMRSKVEYAQEKDAGGKTTVRKIGTAPLMRDGVEYEFDVVGDMDQDNTLVVTKTRCPDLAGAAIRKPGKDLADALRAWLAGEPAPAVAPPSIRKQAPSPGAELRRKLAGSSSNKPYTADGLFTGPELYRLVLSNGQAEGHPDDMAQWSEEQVAWGQAETKRLVEERKAEAAKQAG